jgi:propionate CoA-transferase
MAVNIGFGISANVPRMLIEEGRHGDVTWVIEQGAVGGVPLLDFKFGCASNAEAIMPSPLSVHLFPGRRLRRLAAVLPADRCEWLGERVEARSSRPHVTAGAGGFVDITARAKKHRLLRVLQCRSQAVAGQWRHPHRPGGQGQEDRRRGRAHLVLRQAGCHAGAGHHLCHRALRDEADAGWDWWSPNSRPASTSSATCWRRPKSRSVWPRISERPPEALYQDRPIGLSLGDDASLGGDHG